MSITYNSAMVTEGLGLCLDARNPRSYPGSGSTWIDVSGNNLNATGSSGLSSTSLVSGASWSTPSTSLLNTDTHSVFFTLKLNSSGTYPNGTTGNWEMIFQYAGGGTDRTPGVWRYPSERRVHWRYDPGNTGCDFGVDSAGNQFAINTWYYIGVTKNGATAKGYVNGIEVTTSTVANPKTAGNAAITLFPYYTSGLAELGCVQVYNTVLTASQIEQNFNSLRGKYGI